MAAADAKCQVKLSQEHKCAPSECTASGIDWVQPAHLMTSAVTLPPALRMYSASPMFNPNCNTTTLRNVNLFCMDMWQPKWHEIADPQTLALLVPARVAWEEALDTFLSTASAPPALYCHFVANKHRLETFASNHAKWILWQMMSVKETLYSTS